MFILYNQLLVQTQRKRKIRDTYCNYFLKEMVFGNFLIYLLFFQVKNSLVQKNI